MRHCYVCDAEIQGVGSRRSVNTGSSSRTYFGRRITWSRSKSHGLRTLCDGCANTLDRRQRSRMIVGVIVAGIVGIFILRSGSDRSTQQDRSSSDLKPLAAAQSAVLLTPSTVSPRDERVEIPTVRSQVAAPPPLPPELDAPAPLQAPSPYGRTLPPELASDALLDLKVPGNAAIIQRRLSQLGYPIIQVDGVWGARSVSALRKFKETNGMTMSNLWDAATQSALFSASAVANTAYEFPVPVVPQRVPPGRYFGSRQTETQQAH